MYKNLYHKTHDNNAITNLIYSIQCNISLLFYVKHALSIISTSFKINFHDPFVPYTVEVVTIEVVTVGCGGNGEPSTIIDLTKQGGMYMLSLTVIHNVCL